MPHVAMPIQPMHEWNNMGHRTSLDTFACITVRKETGDYDPVVVRNGAYFIHMIVSNTIAYKPLKDLRRLGP